MLLKRSAFFHCVNVQELSAAARLQVAPKSFLRHQRIYRCCPLLKRCPRSLRASNVNKELDPALHKQIDDSVALLDEMVVEILREASVESAVAKITGEQMDLTEMEVVRKIVDSRLLKLNDTFLTVLGAYYSQAIHIEHDTVTPAVLFAIRQEVIRALSLRLPPATQLLDCLLEQNDSRERVKMIKAAPQDGCADIPACTLMELRLAAGQVVDDLEDNEEIPSRQLLARLIIVREEISNVLRETRFAAGDDEPLPEFYRTTVTEAEAAFLKELMNVHEEGLRMGILQDALRDRKEEQAKGKSTRRGGLMVRPGRLLFCIDSLQGEMLAPGARVDAAVMERLEDIRRETLHVLREYAFSPAPQASTTTEDSSTGMPQAPQ